MSDAIRHPTGDLVTDIDVPSTIPAEETTSPHKLIGDMMSETMASPSVPDTNFNISGSGGSEASEHTTLTHVTLPKSATFVTFLEQLNEPSAQHICPFVLLSHNRL